MCLFSFKVLSPICKVTISILSILYLRSHMVWFCCGTGTLTSKGCLKKRHKISVWTEENRHNTSKSVGISVDLAAKLWSSSSLHNHKVCSNYSCHALPENTLKHITLEQTTCFSMYNANIRMPKGTQMTGNHHRIRTHTTFKHNATHLCDEKFSLSPYVFKPWYVSAILYIWSAKSTLLLVPDASWTTVYGSMRTEPWVYLFTHSVNILYLFTGDVHSSHYRVEQYND